MILEDHFAARADHFRSGRHEEAHQFHGLIEQSAAVAAQVEEEAAHTLRLEVEDGLSHFLCCILVEGVEPNYADGVVDHAAEVHRGELDAAPRDGEVEGLGFAVALHTYAQLRAGLPAHGRGHRVAVGANVALATLGHFNPINRHNHVAAAQSSLCGRHIGVGFGDDAAVVVLVVGNQ